MVEMWDGLRKQATTNYTKQAIVKQLPCGASTGINGNEAYAIFSEVVNNLEKLDARR